MVLFLLRKTSFYLTIFVAVASLSSSVWGATCSDLALRPTARTFPLQSPYQSSVEIEIGANPAVLELFTTTDGTVGPVLGDISVLKLPASLQETLQAWTRNWTIFHKVPWDVLSPQEKADLIMAAASIRNQSFYSNYGNGRTVPGLVYREKIKLHFPRLTRFMGKDYPRGTHEFAASDIFASTKIEFMGPERMSKDLGFELHLRGNLNAGENFLSARALQQALVGTSQNVHQHIVGPLPRTFASPLLTSPWTNAIANDVLQTHRAAEFESRVSLAIEIQMILNRHKFQTYMSSGSVHFSPRNSYGRDDFWRAFVNGGRSKSKDGVVGLRTYQYYDEPVWGLEVRYLSPKIEDQRFSSFLSDVQLRMQTGEYSLSEEKMLAYLKTMQQRFAGPTPQEAFYGLFAYDFRMDELVNGYGARVDTSNNHFENMLYYDWSVYPLFYDNPKLLQQIKTTQEYCLKLLQRGMDSGEVMRTFIKKSGIAHAISQSGLSL